MKNALLFVLLLPLFGCTDPVSAGGSGGFTPTRIVASWTGGASGDPNDRTDTEATNFKSQFSIHPISPLLGGGSENYRNATPALAINAFFCSSTTTLSTFSDKLQCI